MVKFILPFILLVGALSEGSAQSCDEAEKIDECRDLRGCYWSRFGECKRFHLCEYLRTREECHQNACVWGRGKKCEPYYSDYDYYGIDNEDDEEDKGAEVENNITPIKEVVLSAEYEYEKDKDENLPSNSDVNVSADITSSGSQPSHVYLRAGNAMARAPSNSGRND
mmetsp:Transcript_4019/g.6035  ORF Transcript_4019/g.6035 Transcript_4019/m.6035 type:complete len:167 (-) Transcript_4019:47-547(-)